MFSLVVFPPTPAPAPPVPDVPVEVPRSSGDSAPAPMEGVEASAAGQDSAPMGNLGQVVRPSSLCRTAAVVVPANAGEQEEVPWRPNLRLCQFRRIEITQLVHF